MSTWRNIPTSDIDIDEEDNSIDILISSDNQGNNYVSLNLKELKKLIKGE